MQAVLITPEVICSGRDIEGYSAKRCEPRDTRRNEGYSAKRTAGAVRAVGTLG
jgi:hypothetical protein